MRQYIILAFLSFSTSILFGQLSGKISPKFKYIDIDSLVHAEIKCLNKEKVKFILANSVIYYGATIGYSDTTLMPCDNNPFEIFFLFSKGNNFLLKKLDNHGYFKTQEVSGKSVKDFIHTHYNEMEKEILTIKKNSTKEQIQISEKYFIVDNDKFLEFEFPIDYYNNETNLKTFKYQLINLFSAIKKELIKKKQERL
jgi:hypothetical protein